MNNEEETEQVSWTVLIDLANKLVELSITSKEEEDEQVTPLRG